MCVVDKFVATWLLIFGWTSLSVRCQFFEDTRGPILVTEPPSRVDFSNNTGTTLRCHAEGSPPPQIEWVYADGSSVGNVAGLRRVYTNGTLVIHAFPAEKFRQDIHATVYKCLAHNIVGVVSSRTIHIRTVVTQLYEIHTYDEFVITGNTAVFKCNIPSFVLDYIAVTSWIREPDITIDSTSNFDDKYKIMPTGELHIRHVSSRDTSTSYRCQTIHRMTGEIRTSSNGRLFVTEPPGSVTPRIHHIKLNVRARKGDTVTLPCVAQGYPVPVYSWFKKTEDGKHVALPLLGKFFVDVDSLRVDNVQQSDSGVYVCLVNNTVGSERGEATLAVWEPLTSHIQPLHLVANLGQSVRFHCAVSGFPLLATVWLKDAKPIGNAGNGHFGSSASSSRFLLSGSGSSVSGDGSESNMAAPGGRSMVVTSLSSSSSAASSMTSSLAELSAGSDVLQIDSVKRDDRGMYQCLVANDEESVQAAAELRLGDLPPELHSSFSELTVQPGHNVSLRCKVSGIPLPQVSWKLDDMEVTKNNLVFLGSYVDEQGDLVSHVNISSMSASEGGQYVCVASNRVGTVVHKARVNVYGPPFVRPMTRKSAVAGRDLAIRCPFGGYPIDNIYWEKGGVRLPTDHRQVTFHNGTLLVRDVQRTQDAGKYRCVVLGMDGRSASREIEVMVLVPPTVVPFSFQQGQLHVGLRAQVFCSVSEGDQPLSMEWLKDGQPLPTSVDVVARRIDDFTNALVISALGSRHNGNYTCRASNAAATASHSALLSVNVPPKWITAPSDRELMAGERVLVHCRVEGTPNPSVTWMKAVENNPGEYDEVSRLGNSVKQMDNGSLVILEARQQDSGKYSCRATNGVGSGLSKVITLTVRVAASFDVKYRNETVRNGNTAGLKCEPRGDVPLEVTWFYNGRKIYTDSKPRYSLEESTLGSGRPAYRLIVSRADKRDDGIYACKAVNGYGEDELKIRLIVLESPLPPEDINVVSHGSRSMTLSWTRPFDGNAPINRYILQLTETSGSKRDKAFNVTVAGTGSSTTISGLSPAVTYGVQVAAENDVGVSDMSKSVAVTTAEEAPTGAPRDVTAESVETNTVKVSWKPPAVGTQNGQIRGYYVGYRADPSTSAYSFKTVELGSGNSGGDGQRAEDESPLSALIDNLAQFTKYAIVVQAFNGVGRGPKSDDVVVLTSEGVPTKSPNNAVCSALTSQSLRVTWDVLTTADSNGILQGYKVLYSPVDEWYGNKIHETTVLTGHQTVVSGLRKFANYSVQVLGFTRMGDGVRSASIFCLTKEDVPDAPSELKAMASSGSSILVTWRRPSHPNGLITKYNVYMRRTDEPSKEEIAKHAVPPTQTHFEAHGLKFSSRYEFWVTSVTAIGEGQSTKVVTQSTSGPEVPARIISFGNKIVVPWNSDVELPCKTVGVPLPALDWMFEGRTVVQSDRFRLAGNGSLLILKVTGSHRGSYVCKAANSFGLEEINYILHVQVPPKPPRPVVTTTFLFSLELGWIPGDDGGSPIKKYHLYFKRDFSEWEELSFGPQATNYSLDNLECGTRYQLYMTAANKHGVSDSSDMITVKTKGSPPQAPAKRAFVRESASSIGLHMGAWDSGGCPILYFVVQYKARGETEWRLVSNNVLVQTEFVIPDLTTGGRYDLQVTAHNNAGSTVAHYDVLARTPSTGTIEPRPAMEEPPGGLQFGNDIKIVILVTSLLLLSLTAFVTACLCCRRKRQISLEHAAANSTRPVAPPGPGPGRSEFGNTPSAGSFTYLLGSNKKFLKHPNVPNLPRKDCNYEDVSPYATAQIINNSSQVSEMQTFVGEKRTSQIPQVYPALRRQESRPDGTFPRTRRENTVNVEHSCSTNATRPDSTCTEEYTSPVDEDTEFHQGYPIYASFPRTTRSHLHLEHHVPDLLEHGPESSSSNDTSSERISGGIIKSPSSLERRYISEAQHGYDTEETTFVFLYQRDSHTGHLNNLDYLDSDCEKLEFSNFRLDSGHKENTFNDTSTILYHRALGSSPPDHRRCSYDTNRPIDFSIGV